MADTADMLPAIERMPSGIAGLDSILHGGFFKGGTYLILGPPGAGKTILGNQICFNHVASGGRALYVTLLAETHSRMLAHIQSLTFFTPQPIGDTLYYISGYSALEQEGLDALLALIHQEARRQGATLLVLDGAITAEQVAPSVGKWKQFLHELHVSAEILNCTTFLLMQSDSGAFSQPAYTMVDGLLELATRLVDMRTARELQVHKLRGSAFLEGRHLFAITETGLVVHPRIETLLSVSQTTLPTALTVVEQPERMGTGITGLDEMLHGGVPFGSTTMLLGTAGTGKTLLGLHFLHQGALQGQKGLYFGFYETPAQLLRKMARVGLNAVNGQIEFLWQPPIQDIFDVLAERLLSAVQSQNVRRLFIDGIGGFQHTIASPERLDLFLTALFTTLRTLNVTAICSVELPDIFSPQVAIPKTVSVTTALVENILFLRHVELHSQLYRLISILKMRESGYDPAIREFRITDHGIEIASTFANAESILRGIAHPTDMDATPLSFEANASPSQGQQP